LNFSDWSPGIHAHVPGKIGRKKLPLRQSGQDFFLAELSEILPVAIEVNFLHRFSPSEGSRKGQSFAMCGNPPRAIK
jgi:hypothetical protein